MTRRQGADRRPRRRGLDGGAARARQAIAELVGDSDGIAAVEGKGDVEMKVVVAYASKHGSTEGIASVIAERLSDGGRQPRRSRWTTFPTWRDSTAVVLGSAIYAGPRMKEAEFVHRFAEPLAERPVWLFSSGPLGEDVEDEESQPRQLLEMEGIVGPVEHRLFFGALDKSKLGFAERMIVKAVKAPDGDFRDWDEIRAWADAIAADLASREAP